MATTYTKNQKTPKKTKMVRIVCLSLAALMVLSVLLAAILPGLAY